MLIEERYSGYLASHLGSGKTRSRTRAKSRGRWSNIIILSVCKLDRVMIDRSRMGTRCFWICDAWFVVRLASWSSRLQEAGH